MAPGPKRCSISMVHGYTAPTAQRGFAPPGGWTTSMWPVGPVAGCLYRASSSYTVVYQGFPSAKQVTLKKLFELVQFQRGLSIRSRG